MATTLGSAYVKIMPDFGSFNRELGQGLRRRNPKLKVDVDADTKGFNRDIDRQTSQAGKRGGKLFSGGMVAGLAGLAAVTAGVGAAAGVAAIGIFKVTQKASDLNETISKTNAIFGRGAPELMKWASTANRALGLTKNEALTAASGFGDMFQQLKLAPNAVLPMSKSMVGLASDLASFSNADITQVIEAQSAAFRGEYDSLQRFIPNINAARVQAEALRMTHKASVKDLTAAEKAQATYSIMLQDTTRAQGDFARTSGGMANQQRILRAQWEELQTTIGQKFLPVGVKLSTWANDKLIPFLGKAGGAVNRLSQGWSMLVNAFRTGRTEDEGTAIEKLGLFLRGAWEQAHRFGNWWKTELNPALALAADKILPALIHFWREVSSAFKGNHAEGSRLSSTMSAIGKFISSALIPALGILARVYLTGLRHLFVSVGFAINKVVVPALRGLMVVAVKSIGGILTAAAKGFGWIPGLGPKLKKAKTDFDQFAGDVNRALNGIKDEPVRVTATAVVTGDVWRMVDSKGNLGPKMLAGGGGIFGPGTETSDSIPVMGSHNEHMVSAREVRGAGGHRALEALRAQWRHMAGGGPVINASGDTGPLDQGVVKLNAGLSHIATAWGGQLRKDYSTLWDAPSVAGGGWSRMWSIVRAAVPGAILTSGFRPGAITATGNQSMHALGRAIDVGGPMRSVFNFLARHYPESRELIWSPAGPNQRYRGRSHSYGEPTRGDHWDHVHWGYDRGGWMPPGGRGVNLSSKPEAVLTGRQWDAVTQGGIGGDTYVLHTHGPVTTSDVEGWFADMSERAKRHRRL